MKKKFFAVVIICLITAGISLAQNDRPPMHKKEKGNPNPEEMVKKELNMLKKELDLTETQETFIKKILDESAQKMKSLMESGSKDFDEMQRLKDEKETKIKSVLTEEQQEKYKAIKDRFKEKFRSGDGPPDKEK